MSPRAELSPIHAADLEEVGEFLHRHLNRRLSPGEWARAAVPTWPVDSPNHGMKLRADGRIVGVYLAFYSQREVGGVVEDFCNLAAWCVLEEHRTESVRMLRALLAQRGYTFTDLSPSGSVVGLNERLRFRALDTRVVLRVNRPLLRPARFEVITDAAAIAPRLPAPQRRILHDHLGAAAARHLLLAADDGAQCYVIHRRDRRKRLPLFASLLHVSDGPTLARAAPELGHHLLTRHGAAFTLAELRVLGTAAPRARLQRAGRPKMFRSTSLGPESIDDLYSELTCVAW